MQLPPALLPSRRGRAGVVAASAGNHAQGLAYHAHRLGIPATVVMPADTPFTKVTRTEHHGAAVVLAGDGFAGARAEALRIAETTARRSCRRSTTPRSSPARAPSRSRSSTPCPEVDTIVVPVGGGGLVSGIAVAAKAVRPEHRGGRRRSSRATRACCTRSVAVRRPIRCRRSPKASPSRKPGELTRAIVGALVDDLLVVTEQRVEEAVALAIEIEKTVVEGAGAAGTRGACRAS